MYAVVDIYISKVQHLGNPVNQLWLPLQQTPAPSPSPHLPSDPQACVDRALIYTLSHNGSNVRELQKSDADIGQVLAWLEEGQRPLRWRLKDAGRGLNRLWHEFPQLTFIDGLLCRVVWLSKKEVPSSPTSCPDENFVGGEAFPTCRSWHT